MSAPKPVVMEGKEYGFAATLSEARACLRKASFQDWQNCNIVEGPNDFLVTPKGTLHNGSTDSVKGI